MKKKLISIIILSFFLLCLSLSGYAAEKFTLDPEHTYVLWYIKHLGFSTQAGKWYANGTLILDKAKPQNSKVNAIINISEVVTGIKALDEHLKGKLFFDTQQYPIATFISNKVAVTTNSTATVYGMLTLHGVTQPVVLKVKFNQAGVNPLTHKMTVGFSATTNIKRSAFNMHAFLPALGDEVLINIEAEAVQPSK